MRVPQGLPGPQPLPANSSQVLLSPIRALLWGNPAPENVGNSKGACVQFESGSPYSDALRFFWGLEGPQLPLWGSWNISSTLPVSLPPTLDQNFTSVYFLETMYNRLAPLMCIAALMYHTFAILSLVTGVLEGGRGLVASASLRNLLEIQILGPRPRLG